MNGLIALGAGIAALTGIGGGIGIGIEADAADFLKAQLVHDLLQ